MCGFEPGTLKFDSFAEELLFFYSLIGDKADPGEKKLFPI
jgi:hypothetical protein